MAFIISSKRFLRFLVFIIIPHAVFLFGHEAYADTLVTDDIFESQIWTRAQSPYRIENDIIIDTGATLKIEAGTEIVFDGGSLTVFGGITTQGAPDKPVILTSPDRNLGWGINILSVTPASFVHTQFMHMNDGLYVRDGTINFDNSTLSQSSGGITVDHSVIAISSSTIENIIGEALVVFGQSTLRLNNSVINTVTQDAIILFDSSQGAIENSTITNSGFSALTLFDNTSGQPSSVHIQHSDLGPGDDSGIVFFASSELDVEHTKIHDFASQGILAFGSASGTVSQSAIYNNGSFGVLHASGALFNAKNNWWGSETGPFNEGHNAPGTGNAVTDTVEFQPWLIEDPFANTQATCCSNILFIPGIQASRLYTKGLFSENQLWEPIRNGDVEKLFLDASGQSVNKNIYTRDIIEETNYPAANVTVYKGFTESLDTFVSEKIINEWDAFPYDWRYDVIDIVNGYTKNGSGEVTLVETVERLAASSKTGKVTLVTHSNGGLVAKALVRKLEQEGKHNLIDSVIMVAAPQVGTPKAVSTILHGAGQEIFGGVFLSEKTARQFAQNMPAAYNLLPSKSSYSVTSDPIIFMDPSIDELVNFRKVYGDSINDFKTAVEFLLAEKDKRREPAARDLHQPNIANKVLLEGSIQTHQLLDGYQFPQGVQLHTVVGTGLDTVRSIKYLNKDGQLDSQPAFTNLGDGTVTAKSAEFGSTTPYYIHLDRLNLEFKNNWGHRNIMETEPVIELIKSIVAQKPIASKFIDHNRDTSNKTLRLSLHSPAELDIQTVDGLHAGIEQRFADQVSDLKRYNVEIPNSYYMSFGEGQYAGVPADGEYSVTIFGTGMGTFTLNIGNEDSGSQIVFEDVPIFPTSVATLEIQDSRVSKLSIDYDGDGDNDDTINSKEVFNPVTYLQAVRDIIAGLDIKPKEKERLLKRLDKVIEAVRIGKITRVEKTIKKYMKSLASKKHIKKWSAEDRESLLSALETLLAHL